MNRRLPSLSVVIPNFNHGHLIGTQLRAIHTQTVQPSRIIIIDDASTDDSVSRIERLVAGRPDVALICKPENRGVSKILNEGLRMADTECIAFLAADDEIYPGHFERSLTLLAAHPEAALCSGLSLVKYRTGDYVLPHRTAYPNMTDGLVTPAQARASLLRSDGWFMGNTTVFRRLPLLASGGFNPELLSFSDGFASRVLALKHGACFVPEILATWHRVDEGYATSTSRSEGELAQMLTSADISMATAFKDIFPPRLRRRCSARMRFRVLCARLDNLEQHTRPGKGSHVPIGTRLRLLTVRAGKTVLKAWFFLMLRPFDIPRVAFSRVGCRPEPK